MVYTEMMMDLHVLKMAESSMCPRRTSELFTENRNGWLIDHGFDPFSSMVYRCFYYLLLYYRVYLLYLEDQEWFGDRWWFWSILEMFGATTRDDHRARPSVDIRGGISIKVHTWTSIDSEARRKPVWSQLTWSPRFHQFTRLHLTSFNLTI